MTPAGAASVNARLKRGERLADRILRVDHGGEHGAVNIYKAQAWVCRWRAPSLVEELKAFQAHEERHRAAFGKELQQRSVRQGLGYTFLGIGGFILGLATAILGRSAVAATTVAVERVVLRHLREQLDYLRSADEKAYSVVASILAEEKEHHDTALAQVRREDVWPKIVDPVVAAVTEFVIWIGMHR